MGNQNGSSQKARTYINPQETLRDLGKGSAIARDIEQQRKEFESKLAQEQPKGANTEFTTHFDVTSFREGTERQRKISERRQEIQQLVEEIRSEVKAIKARSAEVANEVEQIERATLESLPNKVGVYHIRYFEYILQYLQGIKAKIGEAKTWLMAMNNKKAKRGSAYAARSKKHGTQFSQSQELQNARNVT